MEANHLRMNPGDGESSYASNSKFQQTVIQKAQPVLNEAIKGITNLEGFPECFNIADLGCSSGPNTLLVVSNIMDKVHEICKENNRKTPQFQVCLNDLFGNDFNTIFKSLPTFYAKLKEKGENFGPCFISGVPGSFYGRLFPDNSMHFVHSSYSNHWLSQVPDDIENNKLNIYMAKTCPPNVLDAYLKQFRKDFTMFLQLRSKEIVSGGRIVLTFLGRSIADRTSNDGCRPWELLAKSLADTAKEGLFPESKIHSFNLNMYTPYKDEVRDIVQNQGSFTVDTVEGFEIDLDNAKNIAKMVRAVTEPILSIHFGNSAMDLVFENYERYVAKDLATEKGNLFNVVVSMTKI